MATLRRLGITLAAYLDDLIIFGNSIEECMANLLTVIELFQSLGFVIHPRKTVFVPSNILEFLGFVIDSINMTVSVTRDKKVSIQELCEDILTSDRYTIRDIARLSGKFSSCFIGVPTGKLHFRHLERDKSKALIRTGWKFDKVMVLSEEAKSEITWWKNNISSSFSPIFRDNPQSVLKTDAAKSIGWGAIYDGISTGGHFEVLEKEYHINVLEAKAVLFGLRSLCDHVHNQHIKVLVDNTAAVGAINNMGSSKSLTLHSEVIDIWEWVLSKNNWITASHIPGILNIEADEESRKNETKTEWRLNPDAFEYIQQSLSFTPEVDIFASRINTQLPRFYAFRPDPDAEAIDAFCMDWADLKFYAFPPFICIDKVLQKIKFEKATGILVVPDWPNQHWYNSFSSIVIREIILFPRKDLLYLPSNSEAVHPLHQHLHLRAALVQGTAL